jgi:hypothetical protein
MNRTVCSIDTRQASVWKRAQILVSCRDLLQQCCGEYAASHDVRIEVDDRQFSTAFFAWLDEVTGCAPYRARHPLDYFQYTYGVLLRELLVRKAVRALPDSVQGEEAAPDDIPRWWPAGYMLTGFCVGMFRQTAQQECMVEVATAAAYARPKIWQSFREHVTEEASLAIAYFDKFMGTEPNWSEPRAIENRPAARASDLNA